MSKKDLEAKTCKYLRDLAKEKNIKGRWDMTKEDLIEAILKAETMGVETKQNESAEDEQKVDNQISVEVINKEEKEITNIEIDMKQKMSYIENISIGTLLAFRLSNGKVKSAKVIRKSTKNRKLKVETNYGAEYIISYDDVIWVRTGKRWPKGVYNLLKGLVV